MAVSCGILINMTNISDNICRGNQKNILCSISFFFENRAVYEIMQENKADPDRPQMTIKYNSCALHAG